jgi:hypothetical protein
MGMAPKDFYCMTLWEYKAAREQFERHSIESWRRSRLLMHTMAKLMGGSKSVTSELTKFLPLPFDEDYAPKKLDREQEIDNMKLIAKYKEMGFLKPLDKPTNE